MHYFYAYVKGCFHVLFHVTNKSMRRHVKNRAVLTTSVVFTLINDRLLSLDGTKHIVFIMITNVVKIQYFFT